MGRQPGTISVVGNKSAIEAECKAQTRQDRNLAGTVLARNAPHRQAIESPRQRIHLAGVVVDSLTHGGLGDELLEVRLRAGRDFLAQTFR
jgi:hypothetical protein